MLRIIRRITLIARCILNDDHPMTFDEGVSDDTHQSTIAFRIYRLAEYFALKGRKNEAIRLVQNQSNKVNVIKVYSLVSLKLLKAEQLSHKEDAYVYLDSAITEFERIQDFLFILCDSQYTVPVWGRHRGLSPYTHSPFQPLSQNSSPALEALQMIESW